MTQREFLTTRHPSKRYGISIEVELYQVLTLFVMRNVSNDQHATLMSLIVDGEREFSDQENFYWYLIHVKLDLEARGYLTAEYDSFSKSNYLKVTEEGSKRYKRCA